MARGNMMKRAFSLLLLSTAFGCATIPEMSPMQRRALQSRTFDDTSYESVFRAFKTVLQDDGYIIKNQDMEGGMILATTEKSAWGSSFGTVFTSGRNDEDYITSEGFEVSINLEKLNAKATESRLTIQKVSQYKRGGRDGREILDENTYKTIYDKVRTEIERRKAQNKA